MYRLKDIIAGLKHVVGWEQAYDLEAPLRADLTQTESGLTFQGAHPLMTLANMQSVMPEPAAYNKRYPVWDAAETYAEGDKVRQADEVFISLEGANNQPLDDAGAWAKYNPLSDFLDNAVEQSIARVAQRFISQKVTEKESRNLLERRTLFAGAGRLSSTIENRGKLVGFELEPVKSMGVTAKIERIGLQFTGGTAAIRFYLFHSNSVEPVQVFDAAYSLTNGGFAWVPLADVYLPFVGTDTNAGGAWYLCYDQNQLPVGMEAVNVNKDWSAAPCGSCGQGDVRSWRELMGYVRVSPFAVTPPANFYTDPHMWDIQDVRYTSTQNYGLNLELSVGCDLTDFIVSQRLNFANVIQMQVAADLLRKLAYNPDVRVNRNQVNATRMDVLYELDGNTAANRPGGLGHALEKQYKSLDIGTEGIDRICLACAKKGVRYKST